MPYVIESLVIEDNGGLRALVYADTELAAADGLTKDEMLARIQQSVKEMNTHQPNYCKVLLQGGSRRALPRGVREDPQEEHQEISLSENQQLAYFQNNMTKQEQFDRSYLEMARVWAKNSYCTRRKVGALLVKDRMIISDGFNGTPSGLRFREHLRGSRNR